MNEARGSFEDSGVCYKVAMLPDLMATRLGTLTLSHPQRGPHRHAPFRIGCLHGAAGLAWIGLSL